MKARPPFARPLYNLKAIEKLSRPQELQLWAAWQRGDTAARHQLILKHLPWVASLARRYLRPTNTFEDLIHTGVVALIKVLNSDKYDPRQYPLTYITKYAIANAIRDYVFPPRRETKSKWLSLDDSDLDFPNDVIDPDDPVKNAEKADDAQRLAHMIDLLPTCEAIILKLHYYNHTKFNQIAKVLQQSPQYVSKHHGLATFRLRTFYAMRPFV